jgi:23S rRNA (uracil1939-C5)-methyltransferase
LGLESTDAAVADARENALVNGVTESLFECTDIEDNLAEYCKKHQINTVIFDPPRKGLSKPIIEAIPTEVKKIVYISCDPATQVRDASYLLDSGFKIVMRKGFDMFPQTYHIENVLILERT